MKIWKSRWLRRTVLGVVVALIARTAWLVGERELNRRHGERELAVVVAEVDATDPDWRWAALNAKRRLVPDNLNSAPIITKIKAATPPEWDKRWTELDPAQDQLPPNVRLQDRDRRTATTNLAAARDAVRLSRSLKDFPFGRRDYELAPNVFDTPLPDLQHTREVARVLRWDASVAVEDEEFPRAADALVAGLNASRSVGDEPFLISQLVRLATRSIMVRALERVLAQSTRPEHLAALRLATLQQALAEDATEPLALYGVRGERATFDLLTERLDNGTLSIEKLSGSGNDDSMSLRFGWWIYRGRLPEDRAFCLYWFGAAVAAFVLPVHEQPTAFDALPPVDPGEKRIILRFLPAVNKVAPAYWRNVAETQCAVVGIACERFRHKNARWPKALADLVPEFLPAVPLDPFNSQPLQYATCADGVAVHSIGPKPDPQRPSKYRPGLPDGVEIGFRLWNPDARRLAPPPEPKPEAAP